MTKDTAKKTIVKKKEVKEKSELEIEKTKKIIGKKLILNKDQK